MEIRTRGVKEPTQDTFADSENELLSFCNTQIEKMQKHLKLGNQEGFPSFYEINRALMDHQRVYLSLLTLYYMTKHEHDDVKREYDNWYAEKYTIIRQEENSRNISATKWISTKEIEFTIRMRFLNEHNDLLTKLNLVEEKLSFMRRVVDGWTSHQYVLTQLSKNVMGEARGNIID